MKSPVALLWSLLIDFKRLHPDVEGLDRDFRTIERRFEDEGFSFLAKTLPALFDAIVDGLRVGEFACPRNFKKVPRGSIPRFLSGMICKIFDPVTGRVVEHDEDLVISLSQLLRLFKKTELDDSQVAKLDEHAVQSFFGTESKVLTSIDARLSYRLQSIARYVLMHLNRDVSTLTCKHGPGAVAEKVRGNQKWSLLTDCVLGDTIMDRFGFSDFGLLERIHLREYDSTDFGRQLDLFEPQQVASSGMARLVTVAKDSRARRTITVEPLMNQFVQQGLNQRLREDIEKCPILSQCLDLTDQSENNKLAQVGSMHDTYATIDLKSASDLLSRKLVEVVFSHWPDFCQAMMECRSPFVQHNGCVRRISKYAGMGNATTFPVQSIVFALVSINAILDSDGQRLSYRNVKRAARRIRIFGDDIIIESQYARQVCSGLESAGLIVNRSKSFLNGNFKESCGTDFYRGVLVTPGYLRYLPDHYKVEPRAVASGVALANLFRMRGYYAASDRLRQWVESYFGRKLPYVSYIPFLSKGKDYVQDTDSPVALGWTDRRGRVSHEKWDSRLHQWLQKAPVVQPVSTADCIDGLPALMKFFHVPMLGRDRTHLSSTTLRYQTKISWRWVPCQSPGAAW